MSSHLSWIEMDAEALAHNVRTFKDLLGDTRQLMAVVKANAYGHGLLEVGLRALKHGADWLAVFALDEALQLRAGGVCAPILVFGPTPAERVHEAAQAGIRLTVPSPEALDEILATQVRGLYLHAKIETGTNRQGFCFDELERLLDADRSERVVLEGAYTHFADIEDTTDHGYAEDQLARFKDAIARLAQLGVKPALLHTACTAAALLFEDTYFNMARVGIGLYGLWPSKETRVSAAQLGIESVELLPVMTWKTRITQIKNLAVGQYVGYGRTWRAIRPTRLAVLPVGYANGYDRGLSNHGHVLVRGMRAPLCGRVMMNMCAVDVTDIPDCVTSDEVVLLGRQMEEQISAETLGSWLGTINYEVVTRAEPVGPRVVTHDSGTVDTRPVAGFCAR
jgi:alanine racemase